MNNHDLKLVLNSNVALVVIETYDEARAVELLKNYFRSTNTPAYKWSITEGVNSLGFGLQPTVNSNSCEPEAALAHIKSQSRASAFVMCDFHPWVEDAKVTRQIKDIVLSHASSLYGSAKHKLIFISHKFTLPPELTRYAASVSLSMPSDEEILAIIRDEARQWANEKGALRIKTDNVTLKKLVSNLRGLPHQDVRRLAHGAITDDGAITEADLPEVTKAKFALMEMDGVLHFEYSTAHMKEVAGLENLKGWLTDRQHALKQADENPSLDRPKGVLLFGVQGGGKSLAAKAIAGVWGLPLLRLDMASLFNKFVGETERNLRDALKLADLMSPCVLWIDELEKGMASGESDSGTPKRLLGTLLTWMAERKSQVFMVATSNDISQLPPELMRKGRFDEIFFVDLPSAAVREAIFAIHLTKRGHEVDRFNLKYLAQLADGFTGAEIEQAVVSAIYASMALNTSLQPRNIEQAIQNTQPLSVVMSEKMAELRHWAQQRAVFA